ncbi:MAG: hypothetical protein V1716_03365 [Candidatus Uhrbacteria bacterium]
MPDSNGNTVANARSAAQAEEMRGAAEEGRCLFCQLDHKKNQPLNKQGEFDPEGRDWPLLWVWLNPYPQKHHSHHIMIVPRRHIADGNISDLTPDEWLQILDAIKWAIDFYQIPGGGFVGRFGDPEYNAGTISHLHFQIQVPDRTGNVKATFCKDRSPVPEAARLNREAYFQDEVVGFVVLDQDGHALEANFHWRAESDPGDEWYGHACVHAKAALLHIAKMFGEGELQPFEMIPAVYRKGQQNELGSRRVPFAAE